MNLSKLIHEIWKDDRVQELGIRKGEVKILVNVFLDHILKSLLNHGIVKLQGLFTLKIKKAKGRKIRNPQTGEIMYCHDYNKLNIAPSKRLEDGLKNYVEGQYEEQEEEIEY